MTQRLQEYLRAASPKNLLDSGICETYGAFDASQEKLTTLRRNISAGANQRALRSLGTAFCQTAARHDWVCDMARRIFSGYSSGSSQGFISIGNSRVNDF